MRTRPKSQQTVPPNRSTIPFLMGSFLGFGISAMTVFFYFVVIDGGSLSNAPTSIRRRPQQVGYAPDSSLRSATPFDSTALKKAIVAVQSAAREQKREGDRERELRGLQQKDEERIEEMRVLRQALPENRLLPVPKTQEERRREREDSQDEWNIRHLMIEGRATDADLKDYYELKSKRFRDEMALLDFCDQNLSDAEAQGNAPLGYCIDLQATGIAVRREADARALATLDQAYRNGFPNDRKPIAPVAAPSEAMNQRSKDERDPLGGQNQVP